MDKNVFSERHMGVTFGFYAKDGYFSSQEARDEVDAIAAAGAGEKIN